METTNETSIRDEIITYLKSQPKDITINDIMYHLFVIQKIQKGQKELRAGQSYGDEEVEELIQQWLK